jgi:DNA-binding LacI/PurR family transcriptional regulator
MAKKNRTSLKDIAQKANVSVSTVSMALSDSNEISNITKKKVWQISQQLGYQNNVSIISKPLNIGFCLFGKKLDEDIQVTQQLSHMLANSRNMNINFGFTAIENINDKDSLIKQLLDYSRNLDGIVVSNLVDIDVVLELQKNSIPWVARGGIRCNSVTKAMYSNNGLGHVVRPNWEEIAKNAVAYLVSKGHKRIGFACRSIHPGLQSDHYIMGYRLALAENDLPFEKNYIMTIGNEPAKCNDIAKAFTSLPNPPTGFFVPDMLYVSPFIYAMQFCGNNLGPDSIVSSIPFDTNYPYFSHDVNYEAKLILIRLRELCEDPQPYVSEELLPFTKHNFD